MTYLTGKIALVTGSNSGIGLATALGLAQMGATVLMHARNREKGLEAVQQVQKAYPQAQVELFLADLASQKQIRALAAEIQHNYDRLDVLINNAALVPAQRTLTEDGIETQFAINHLAYFLLTHLLLPQLKASPQGRVVNVSSNIHTSGVIDFDDLQAEKSYPRLGWGQYGNTKLMNVVFTIELARRLAGTSVTANSAHPGLINTQLGRSTPFVNWVRPFFSKPQTGAETSLYLASSPEVAQVTGKYFAKKKLTPHNPVADDPQIAKKLWDISAELVGL